MINGNFGIIVTPLDRNREIDFLALGTYIEQLSNSAVQGIVCCGSTSEFVFFSAEENKRIMNTVSEACQNQKILIGGATAPDLKGTLSYIEHMAKRNYKAALVAPPFYFNYSQSEVLEFYRQLDALSPLPIIAYNIAAFTSGIPLSIFEPLIGLKNIVGLKNSSQNIKEIAHQVQMAKSLREDFFVLTGTDDAILPSLVSGCVGNFTAFGALLPDLIQQIYVYYHKGDFKSALAVQQAILPLLRLCDAVSFPIGYKLLGEVLGISNQSYRQSLSPKEMAGISDLRMKIHNELENVYKKLEDIVSE